MLLHGCSLSWNTSGPFGCYPCLCFLYELGMVPLFIYVPVEHKHNNLKQLQIKARYKQNTVKCKKKITFIAHSYFIYLFFIYLFITIWPFKPGPTQHYKSNKFIKFRSLFYSQNNITDFCNYKVSAFEKRGIISIRNFFTWACQGSLIKGNWVYIRGWVVKGWVTKSNCWLTTCSFHFWAVVIV